MREILFRGKRTDTGEWVEGYYRYTCGCSLIIDKEIGDEYGVGKPILQRRLPQNLGYCEGDFIRQNPYRPLGKSLWSRWQTCPCKNKRIKERV